MKMNLLGNEKSKQDDLRLALWKIFEDEKHNLNTFSKLLGLTHQGLSAFFRGGNISRKTEIRLKEWMENKNSGH